MSDEFPPIARKVATMIVGGESITEGDWAAAMKEVSGELIARAKNLWWKEEYVEHRLIMVELIEEIRRLRSEVARINQLREHEMDKIAKQGGLYEQYSAAKDARIAELEGENQDLMANCNDLRGRCWKAEGLNERLEKAFLDSLAARLYYEHYPGVSDAYSWHDYPEDACHCMPKEYFRKKACAALDKIKAGGSIE